MSQPQDDLVARASDPNAELTTLHELANNYPGLRPYIAENPRTYPALLEWLGSLGDPAVDAALARRNAAATTQALSLEQAQAAIRAAAGEQGAAGQANGQAPQTGSEAPTQAIAQPDVTRAVTPERRPIMEGRQATRDAAAPTAAYAYQQPPQQPGYQQPAYTQTAYQQPQPPAGDQGVFGVGTPESEAQQRSSNRWLWILAAVAWCSWWPWWCGSSARTTAARTPPRSPTPLRPWRRRSPPPRRHRPRRRRRPRRRPARPPPNT
ncbi:hypothetical protein [Actinomyces ruminis]|uniref:variant leucine-rich repeat-containing protein n=1 Tax=Actinomyces ruminis TaxID=1937003 RepID=UPI0030B8345A